MKERFKKIKEKPFLMVIWLSVVMELIFVLRGTVSFFLNDCKLYNIVGYTFLGLIIVLPLLFLSGEIVLLSMAIKKKEMDIRKLCIFDVSAVAVGLFFEWIYMELVLDMVINDWDVQLYNLQKHSPINTEMFPTILVLMIISIVGYIIWTLKPLKEIPPLVSVLCIGAIYLGPVLEIIFTVQCESEFVDFPLLILPACMIMMCVRTILVKVREWEDYGLSLEKVSKNSFLQVCNDLLYNSKAWPVLGLVAMIPLLGVVIGILVLFGQAPDAVIKAWTETADWALSQREAPQSLAFDEHYLCTVAAGGHKKVVKPKRYGMRHGHRVIVNRQLCVANAFEQVLEERTPKFHKRVRHFYDTYGFPIAKLIKTKTAADIVYFIMKPLEWIFLIVIYLTDVKPENRIAVQYMGTVK